MTLEEMNSIVVDADTWGSFKYPLSKSLANFGRTTGEPGAESVEVDDNGVDTPEPCSMAMVM